MSNIGERRVYFNPSKIENIDRSVFNYVKELNLFTDTNSGWKQVPITWATAERSYHVKNDKNIRDEHGMLIMPLISIRRSTFTKSLKSPGIFQGNVPEVEDEQGGSLNTSRVLYQEKSMQFANADARRLYGQKNYPRPNPKIVYKTVSVPMPVNVEVNYEIIIRTEYQQQMNELMVPFITTPGTINYISLRDDGHRYEGFIQEQYTSQDNLSDYSSEERKFETKIDIKVIGYLVGEDKNRDRPAYAVRESIVEVKIPRERISLGEVPEHEYGSFYGLSGIPSAFIPGTVWTPQMFSNTSAAGAAGAGTGTSTAVSSNVVTKSNIGEVLAETFVFRELLKDEDVDPPAADGEGKHSFTTSKNVRFNTEAVYLNGLIQAVGENNDYTISGNVIKFNLDDDTGESPIDRDSSVYITYIIG